MLKLSFRQRTIPADPEGSAGGAVATVDAREIAQTAPQKTAIYPTAIGAHGFGVVEHRSNRGLVIISFILVVLVPLLAASIYSLLWASERYQSEFRVALRSVDPVKLGGIGEMFGFAGLSQTGNDAHAVVQYLQSRAAIADMDQAITLPAVYSDPETDWFSRLAADAKIEKVERYWRRMVSAHFEPSTGTIIVSVTAFSPEHAFGISKSLLAQADAFVNRLSAKARRDTVLFAETEVRKAEERLSKTRLELAALQDKERILDPLKSAESTIFLAAKLKEEIARQRAALNTQRTQLGLQAPSVRTTLNVIAGLEQELARIESLATATGTPSDGKNKPLSSVLGEFQKIADQRDFAEKAYASALASLETARLEADRKQIYLATIIAPNLAQEPSFPDPLRDIPIVGVIALCIWLVLLMIVYTIREHL